MIRKLSWPTEILLQAYSLFVTFLVHPSLRIFSLANQRMHKQLQNRNIDPSSLDKLNKLRNEADHAVVFFCSSAGEYEQARPIVSRLVGSGKVMVHCFFFSESGLSFAEKSPTPDNFSYSLAPIDTAAEWRKYWSVLQPSSAVVIRHELWPGFLATVYEHCPVLLANVSETQGKMPALKRLLKSALFVFIDQIHAISQHDRDSINKHHSSENTDILATGDSKYDRVIERAEERKESLASLRSKLDDAGYGNTKRIIVGSAWPADLELLLPAFRSFLDEDRSSWRLIVAPHDIGAEMIDSIVRSCKGYNLTFEIFSKINTSKTKNADVLIVDEIGYLAELYGLSEAAMIGGAVHHKIHNVLEAASYGIPICFGPRYHSQKEAIHLVEHSLATVVNDSTETKNWLYQAAKSRNEGSKLRREVVNLSGAADRITTAILNCFDQAKSISSQRLHHAALNHD